MPSLSRGRSGASCTCTSIPVVTRFPGYDFGGFVPVNSKKCEARPGRRSRWRRIADACKGFAAAAIWSARLALSERFLSPYRLL